jgi:cytochrome P450
MPGDSATTAYPLGGAITLAQLEADPYPVYARLQALEPISWVDALGMWYVTRYEDVRAITLDQARFTTAFERSLILDTFGPQMLSTEGAEHDRYRRAFAARFAPGCVRQMYEAAIHTAAARLIRGFKHAGTIELRAHFAARLPILTMLEVFGMPLDGEAQMRRWYDAFERALSNFAHDEDVRCAAHAAVRQFHDYIDEAIAAAAGGDQTLLSMLVNAPAGELLNHAEIRRNMSIIFFGGISTVEALILNSLWALFEHPETLRRVQATPALLPKVIEETIRWLGPVQSATRHAIDDCTYLNVHFAAGDAVNCMLAAANRDPSVFAVPERFDIDRTNLQRHLGFATGTHACLGLHLARAEGRIALEHLLAELPGLRLLREKSPAPSGYEFRQPRSMWVAWNSARAE